MSMVISSWKSVNADVPLNKTDTRHHNYVSLSMQARFKYTSIVRKQNETNRSLFHFYAQRCICFTSLKYIVVRYTILASVFLGSLLVWAVL